MAQRDLILLANCEGLVGMAAAQEVLERRGTALDAVEQGARRAEADPAVRSVGRGGAPNLLGVVECDAAIMDGHTLHTGAVGALRHHLHAVSVARQVMTCLPHVFLVGEGADRFAREVGAEAGDLLTPEVDREHRHWIAANISASEQSAWPEVPLAPHAWRSAESLLSGGTVAFLARDVEGRIAVATSTSGWARKYPGRLGDSAVIGAGLYADDRYGACACTHTGEMIVRASTSHSVVLYMKRGATVQEACFEALEDLASLRGGYRGPVLIHALDRAGECCIVSTDDYGDRYAACLWRPGMAEPERVRPRLAS